MHKFASLNPLLFASLKKVRISIIEKHIIVLSALSLGRGFSSIPANMASRYLKLSRLPLVLNRPVVRARNIIARSSSRKIHIPLLGSEHESDTPSESVLSRLSIFGLGRDMSKSQTERKQETGLRAEEPQRKTEQKEQTKKEETASDPYVHTHCLPCNTIGQSQQEGDGGEGADTGADVSVPDCSSGDSGVGYSGGDFGVGWSGGGCDGGC